MGSPVTASVAENSTNGKRASYSFDFLHSVGAKMSGISSRTYTQTRLLNQRTHYINNVVYKFQPRLDVAATKENRSCFKKDNKSNYRKLQNRKGLNSSYLINSNYVGTPNDQQCNKIYGYYNEPKKFSNINNQIFTNRNYSQSNKKSGQQSNQNSCRKVNTNSISSPNLYNSHYTQNFQNNGYKRVDNSSSSKQQKQLASSCSSTTTNSSSNIQENIKLSQGKSNLFNNISNDYESDSSHSSHHNYDSLYGYGKYHTQYQNQFVEYPSLMSFPIFTEDDLFADRMQNYSSTSMGLVYSPRSAQSINEENNFNNENQNLYPTIKEDQQFHIKNYTNYQIFYPIYDRYQLQEYYFSPADRFLAKSHLVVIKKTPSDLLNGSKWDKLTKSIWDKFLLSQQTEDIFKKKMYLWRYLYIIIKKVYPRYGLYLVGSTISGFGMEKSDIDMCLAARCIKNIEPRTEALLNLLTIKDYLKSLNAFENFDLIEAKVPILKFRDLLNNIDVDLNYNNCVGIKNTHLLYCYSQLDWRLQPLVLIVKLWAQYHGINNAKTMTISSYSLVLMVIHFLQNGVDPPILPCLHKLYPNKFKLLLRENDFSFVDMNEEFEPYQSGNTKSLAELFLNFLEYYSYFDYINYAISIRIGSVLPIDTCRQAKSIKNDIHQWRHLCIEEPFDLTNTARSVYDGETFERIKSVFLTSYHILKNTLCLDAIFSNSNIPENQELDHLKEIPT